MRKKSSEENIIRKDIKRIYADPAVGLTESQADERIAAGYANLPVDPPTKTVGQIVRSNMLTYFNMIFIVFAVCVILVGAFKNLTFMPVIIINTAIGIIQELRAKKTLDKLSLVSAPKATVIRNGKAEVVNTEQVVLDDIVVFSAGNQIYADAIVLEGEIFVNESLITGEADEIPKHPGDTLHSGSFVISGKCKARLDKVGKDSFASKMTLEARKSKGKGNNKSEMMRSLDKIVKFIGVIIVPFGVIMFINQQSLGIELAQNVTSTIAALVGMIPEGLYLLTTIALTVSVMRLAQKRTVVHDLGCIETLARVDVLCVDKTGTITENKMIVKDIALMCEDRFIEDDIRLIMSDYVGNIGADNETMLALKRYFTGTVQQTAIKTLPFSSKTKYSGVSYAPDESYLLGAPEFILKSRYSEYSDEIEKYSKLGCRVLLLALYDGDIEDKALRGDIMPLALILLTNKVRKEAPDTFKFFEEQGVTVKVISGDNPIAVSQVAIEAGINNADLYIDASTLDSDKKIKEAAEKYVVFGRVTPEQKRKLVRAMKKAGHTVAMTGDGVNDVLALKTADCSIAMASGSDVACHVSQLVLLDSDFSAMPSVVMEGRRVINNIERSASLFLVKNIFSFFLSLISLIAVLPYPINASQLSLVSAIVIGIPSFVLALEPNKARVEGNFIRNVLFKALPSGFTNLILVLAMMVAAKLFGFSYEVLSTSTAMIMTMVGFVMLFNICRPFNKIRVALIVFLLAAMAFALVFLSGLFSMHPITGGALFVLIILMLMAYPLNLTITRIMTGINNYMHRSRKTSKH